MDDLKQSVQNAVYEQKDPLLIYKFESFELFKALIEKINKEIITFLLKATLPTKTSAQEERYDSQINLLKVELRNIDIQRDSAIYDRKIELKKQELEKTERSTFSRDSVTVPVFTKAYKKDLEKQVRALDKMNTRLKDKLLEKNITTKVTLPDSVIDLLAKYDLLDE